MKLDTDQIKAATYVNNHSLIIAGAGSGKTTTLLGKFDFLIKKNINPNSILVISFTNETVNNFKNKCNYNIDVYTFHKLAYSFIDKNYEIADNNLLEDIILEFLNNIPIKLKKKIIHMYTNNIYTKKRYSELVNSNKSNLIKNEITCIIRFLKTNLIDIKKIDLTKLKNNQLIIIYLIVKINEYYKNYLKLNRLVDFDDIIIKATNTINSNIIKHKYKYILVDEYQDISQIRLNFLLSLIKQNNAVLTAVGDDWQSIYGFSGSNINLFYNFNDYFKNSKIFYITHTYRCPQEIINKAGTFIMKNDKQIKKELQSINQNKKVIYKIYYYDKKKIFKKIIKKFINLNKSIMFLSRNNYDIYEYTDKSLNFSDSYLTINGNIYNNIRFLTIHKSKGLEADIVIILNLSNSYDSLPTKKRIQ